MTVAAHKSTRVSVAARVASLDAHLETLILAGRQLELGIEEIGAALKDKWERSHD